MLRRVALIALAFMMLSFSSDTLRAQAPNGIAIAVFVGSLPFDAPIQATDTGIRMQFLVLCYSRTGPVKQMTTTQVDIPDSTGLVGTRTLITDALVAACLDRGVTVARGSTLFPAFQLGQ